MTLLACRYTVQCVLPFNLFTEKFYVFFWWWMIFVLICTTVNLFFWLLRTLLKSDRLGYIRGHLIRKGRLPKKRNPHDDDLLEQFTYSYLRYARQVNCSSRAPET